MKNLLFIILLVSAICSVKAQTIPQHQRYWRKFTDSLVDTTLVRTDKYVTGDITITHTYITVDQTAYTIITDSASLSSDCYFTMHMIKAVNNGLNYDLALLYYPTGRVINVIIRGSPTYGICYCVL